MKGHVWEGSGRRRDCTGALLHKSRERRDASSQEASETTRERKGRVSLRWPLISRWGVRRKGDVQLSSRSLSGALLAQRVQGKYIDQGTPLSPCRRASLRFKSRWTLRDNPPPKAGFFASLLSTLSCSLTAVAPLLSLLLAMATMRAEDCRRNTLPAFLSPQ